MREEIRDIFEKKGASEYAGEPVSQLEHALQTAALAENEGASPALVTVALLHDIGHLLEEDPARRATSGHDGAHEDRGAEWLETWFGREVIVPINLHVSAKRYLCATNPDYYDALSPASKHSLELQGGMFSVEQCTAWIEQDYAQDGLRLRHWDDAAKIPHKPTPPLSHYLDIAAGVAK